MAAVGGFLAFIVTTTLSVNAYFVPRADHEKDMLAMEQQSGDVMRGIRIEQMEDRVWQLREYEKQRSLTHDEQRRLERAEDTLKRLYQQEDERK